MSGGLIFKDRYGRRNRDVIMPKILVLGEQLQFRTLLHIRNFSKLEFEIFLNLDVKRLCRYTVTRLSICNYLNCLKYI